MTERKMKPRRIPFQKQLWCHIRMYQHLHDISNESLANIMMIGERTLKEYDKKADKITLDKVDNFLSYSGISITELMNQ